MGGSAGPAPAHIAGISALFPARRKFLWHDARYMRHNATGKVCGARQTALRCRYRAGPTGRAAEADVDKTESLGNREIICPICGWDGLSVLPYAEWPGLPVPADATPPYEDLFGGASYEVCTSCGFEFGFDDNPGAGEGVSFDEYRAEWIAGGYAGGHSLARPRPAGTGFSSFDEPASPNRRSAGTASAQGAVPQRFSVRELGSPGIWRTS